MLAHELTHVIQQRAGAVDGKPAEGGVSISDPSDRFERAAEATAELVMGGHRGSTDVTGTAGSVLRQEQQEQEELQTSSIQRQDDDLQEDEQQL